MKQNSLGILAAAVIGITFGSMGAKATSIEISGPPVITPAGLFFDWAYTLVLTPGNVVTTADPTPGLVADSVVAGSTGSVAVFYDVGGLGGAPAPSYTAAAATATVSTSGTTFLSSDATPLGIGVTDTGATNIIVTFTSGIGNPGPGNLVLGTVHIFSSFGTGSLLSFAGRDYDPTTVPVTGNTNTNSQATVGPSVIPLPAAVWTGLSMLGGLGLLGAVRRRKMA